MAELTRPPTPVWVCTRCSWYSVFGPGDMTCMHCYAPLRESVWTEEPRIKSSAELMEEMRASRESLIRALRAFRSDSA